MTTSFRALRLVDSEPITADDHRDAARLASGAGHALMRLRSSAVEWGLSPASLGAAGDRDSNHLLTEMLRLHHPDDAVLSEESRDLGRRLRSRRVWIIDPLDGTAEFATPHRGDWAVHVALVVDGVPRVAAVAVPAIGRVFSTALVPRVPPPRPGRPRIVVSRSRPPGFTAALADHLGGRVSCMGSAGAKAMAVVTGRADLYVHAGGQYEWDSAAPVGVALAAGLHASRIDGSELRYNQADPWLPDVVICRRSDADHVLEAIRSIGGLDLQATFSRPSAPH